MTITILEYLVLVRLFDCRNQKTTTPDTYKSGQGCFCMGLFLLFSAAGGVDLEGCLSCLKVVLALS